MTTQTPTERVDDGGELRRDSTLRISVAKPIPARSETQAGFHPPRHQEDRDRNA